MGNNSEKRKTRAAAVRHSYFGRDEALRAARKRGRAFLSKVFLGLCIVCGVASSLGYAGSSLVKLGSINWSGVATLLFLFLSLPILFLALSRFVFGLIVPMFFLSVWKVNQLLHEPERSALAKILRQDQIWFFALDGRTTRWVEKQIRPSDLG